MLANVLQRLESVVLTNHRGGATGAAGGGLSSPDTGGVVLGQDSSLTLLVSLAKLGQPVSRELHFAALQGASQHLDVSAFSCRTLIHILSDRVQ